MVGKMKPETLQFIPVGFGGFFSIGQNTSKDPAVFQQGIVDVSHIGAVIPFGLLLVVVIITAIIITEFFVASSL